MPTLLLTPFLCSFVLHLELFWVFFLSDHFCHCIQPNLLLAQRHSFKVCKNVFPELTIFHSPSYSLSSSPFLPFSGFLVSQLALLPQTHIWYHFECVFPSWWLLPSCPLPNTPLISITFPPAAHFSFPYMSLLQLSFLHFHLSSLFVPEDPFNYLISSPVLPFTSPQSLILISPQFLSLLPVPAFLYYTHNSPTLYFSEKKLGIDRKGDIFIIIIRGTYLSPKLDK